MKKREVYILTIVLVLFAGLLCFAQEDIQKHPTCQRCGMDRLKFAHSRMLIEYEDGTTAGTCSIRCTAVDLELNKDKTAKTLMVGDYYSKELIDAKTAFWVIGGSKPGIMTKRAKWAFQKKEDAEKFIVENGGDIANFEQALKVAQER
ncbi:MAG: nitrous oxide reductase accessory protein NosL [Candidatus Aminicenantes bacterium]|nr:nitrous oxide reductase accessory protein NosL [Candidatus Aminicenantes bacterium]MDH5386139.1 nitrous oxide reductase accessory protein NosL [Candidatus Aminicenantes bacterium]